MGVAYYNENDPFAAAWLRNLISAGLIAPGDVDERSIEDVVPLELAKYVQCHFFAGIGGWSYALRQAGWPDDRQSWSGSCPCQPFSAAGKGGGFDDERHLWPAFYHLIAECRPDTIFGEQVASKDGLAWLDLVHTDMENTGYAFGALDSCAAGFGAPHIRQRLYWVAYANSARLEGWHERRNSTDERITWPYSVVKRLEHTNESGEYGRAPSRQQQIRDECGQPAGGVGHADGPSGLWQPRQKSGKAVQSESEVGEQEWKRLRLLFSGTSNVDKYASDRLEQSSGIGWKWREAPAPGYEHDGTAPQRPQSEHGSGITGASSVSENRTGPTNGYWRNADWLACKDERWRAVEPGTFPLAHGVANRMGLLRGYGNAIVAPQAEEFIKVAMEYAP